MIGLIFGETDFPIEILKKIKKRKLKYLIIDLSKSKKFKYFKIFSLGSSFYSLIDPNTAIYNIRQTQYRSAFLWINDFSCLELITDQLALGPNIQPK